MTIKTSHYNFVSMARQSAWGTAVDRTSLLGIVQTSNVSTIQSYLDIRGNTGQRDINDKVVSKREVRGTINTLPVDGRFLVGCLGLPTSTGSAPNYTHTFTGQTGTKAKYIDPLSLELSNTAGSSNIGRVIDSAKFNTVTFNFAEEEALSTNLEFIGRDATTITSSTTISLITKKPYMFYEGTITVDSEDIAEIESGSISISNNLRPYYPVQATNGTLTQEFIALNRDYSVVLDFKFKDNTHYDKLLSASATGVTISVVFSKGANESITFTLNNATFNEDVLNAQNEVEIVESMTFVPRSATIVFKDNISSYN